MKKTAWSGLLCCKAIVENKKRHAGLVERLNEVITQNLNINDLLHDIERLMVVWVIEHIIHEDSKIAESA